MLSEPQMRVLPPLVQAPRRSPPGSDAWTEGTLCACSRANLRLLDLPELPIFSIIGCRHRRHRRRISGEVLQVTCRQVNHLVINQLED